MISPHSSLPRYLGQEVRINPPRAYLDYSDNAAPAYVPSYLCSSRSLTKPVEKMTNKFAVDIGLLVNLQEDIKNHIETRIQLFLIQLLLVYKTNLSFALYTHADLQVGKIDSKDGDKGRYAAAHSGTLPTLRLTSSSETSSISFAKDSYFYHLWNTTVYLPEIVNQIDSTIDRTKYQQTVSFREKATILLNESALYDKSPKEALRSFLLSLKEVIESTKALSRGNEKSFVCELYLDVTQAYLQKLEHPLLLQKLCFQPIQSKIDDRFYLKAQQTMHAALQEDMQKLAPRLLALPAIPNYLDTQSLQTAISRKIEGHIPGKTLENYIHACSIAHNVHATALRYLFSLNSLSVSQKEQALDVLYLVKEKNQPITEAEHFYAEAIKTIQTLQQAKTPRNIPLILLHTLFNVSKSLPRSQNQQVISSQDLNEKIANKLTQDPNNTVRRYINHLSCQKVQKAAKDFFAELQTLPKERIDAEIETLLAIKNSTNLPPCLSTKALTFYQVSLETIRLQENKPKLQPRNLGLILAHVLIK